MKHTVELDFKSVNELIRKSLMFEYEIIRHSNKIDCSEEVLDPDEELLKALETVIQYYSSIKQFKEWKKSSGADLNS